MNMQRFLLEMRHYRRGIGDLSLIALFGVVSLVLTLTDSTFTLILAPFLPTLAISLADVLSARLGIVSIMTVGIFFSLCVTAAWFFLCYYAKRHSAVMIAATALYAADLLVLFVFSVTSSYAFGMTDSALRLFLLLPMIRASVAAVRIGRMPPPDPTELERMMQNLVPVPNDARIGDSVGDLPPEESDSLPLRDAVPRRRTFFDARLFDMHITVVRSRGLTELCVDGKVYAEAVGVVELFYVLSATVSGHRITARFVPGSFSATMILTVDGYLLGRLRRFF